MDNYIKQYKPAASIANYLSLGSKSNGDQTLGFELEHFVVHKGSHLAVPYLKSNDPSVPSVEEVLEGIKPFYTETVYEKDEAGVPHLFGLSRECAAVTLEPGSQLEISIGPAHSVQQIEKIYQRFRGEIDLILDTMGLELLELGYHPTSQARDLSLLPKQRYAYMDQYFAGTGKHGICMMRATASTQVSIDFSDECDALKKLLVANALGPLFAFITDNSPVFETELVGSLGGTIKKASSGLTIPKRMARMVCWDDTDPDRSLIVRDGFDKDFSFTRYANTLLDSPGIFLPQTSPVSSTEYLGSITFREALPDTFIDEEMILHILSLFFFDARFKTYLELRQADAMPLEYALAYTALVSGIFYHQESLDAFAEAFTSLDSTDIASAKSALRSNGFEALIYGRKAYEWLNELFDCARKGLSRGDVPYLSPLSELISERKTLLDA